MRPFGNAFIEAMPRSFNIDYAPQSSYPVLPYHPGFENAPPQATPRYSVDGMAPFAHAWTQAVPIPCSNEGPFTTEFQQPRDVPLPYPCSSSSAWIPMMENSISPSAGSLSASNTQPNAMPNFSYANAKETPNLGHPSLLPCHDPSYSYEGAELQIPQYLRAALEELPDISQPRDNDPPMRETSSSKNIRLAGQARARPSSITSSAHSVEAPSPNNNHRHQPSAETRRPAAESSPGPALYHSRSPRSIGKDFWPTTGPIPTSFPQGNTSAHRNDASLNHPKPATSDFKHWAPPSVSSATPSPPRSFETDDSTPLPSQAEKRPRQDEPISETEGKRKKTNARERTPKKIRDEFQPNPTIIAWAVEDGKGEKDKFRAFYAPSRR